MSGRGSRSPGIRGPWGRAACRPSRSRTGAGGSPESPRERVRELIGAALETRNPALRPCRHRRRRTDSRRSLRKRARRVASPARWRWSSRPSAASSRASLTTRARPHRPRRRGIPPASPDRRDRPLPDPPPRPPAHPEEVAGALAKLRGRQDPRRRACRTTRHRSSTRSRALPFPIITHQPELSAWALADRSGTGSSTSASDARGAPRLEPARRWEPRPVQPMRRGSSPEGAASRRSSSGSIARPQGRDPTERRGDRLPPRPPGRHLPHRRDPTTGADP